jgi:orotate phosphoribosyltransferase
MNLTGRSNSVVEQAIGSAEGYDIIKDRFSDMVTNYRAQLKARLRQKSLVKGVFKLASGRTSNYYLDCKLTTLDPEGSVLTGHAILELLREHGLRPNAVGGPTIGADPIVTATAAISFLEADPLPAFLIRKERKGHGREKVVEGIEIKAGLRVVIVDEVCTTGKSTLDAIEAAEEEGLEIIAVLSLVDREEGGSEKISKKYPYFPVFKASELMEEVDGGRKTPREASGDTQNTLTRSRGAS